MKDQIGSIAGKIWDYLSANGKTAISTLVRDLNETERMVSMGLGWLAREDKIELTQEGRASYVALKKS